VELERFVWRGGGGANFFYKNLLGRQKLIFKGIFKNGFGLYAVVKTTSIHAVKKLNGKDFIKVIEGFRCVIINTNFLFHLSLHLFIGIYYDRSSPFKNLSITSIKSSPFNL
jgi:hypothetical protein